MANNRTSTLDKHLEPCSIYRNIANYDSEFSGQEYLGLYPTVDKITNLYGRLNLGISNVGSGTAKRDIPLKEAASTSQSIYFVS